MPLLLETWFLLILCFAIGLIAGRLIWKRD